MSANVRKKLEARLREGQDDDLRQATAGIEDGRLSDMVRDGMRIMLGIRTKKCMEIRERPLVIPPEESKTIRPTTVGQHEKTVQPTRPTVFMPKQRD